MEAKEVFKFYDRAYRVLRKRGKNHNEAYDDLCIIMKCQPFYVKDNTVLRTIQTYIITKIKNN